nr:CP [Bipolaris zeicola chrysovirus 1]
MAHACKAFSLCGHGFERFFVLRESLTIVAYFRSFAHQTTTIQVFFDYYQPATTATCDLFLLYSLVPARVTAANIVLSCDVSSSQDLSAVTMQFVRPDDLLASMLEVAPGFGQPDAFARGEGGGVHGVNDDLFFIGAPGTVPAAQDLLSVRYWSFFNKLSAQDVDEVSFQYTLERLVADLSSPNLRSSVVRYPAPTSRKECVVVARGSAPELLSYTGPEARRGLNEYALQRSTNVDPGVGSEHHHVQTALAGKDLRMVLTLMWLVHLDVAARADVNVRLEPMAVRWGLHACRNPADECEAAKALRGVRMHVNSCTDVLKALLVAATSRRSVAGLSARVSRYSWPEVPLVLYGGTLPQAQRVHLLDANATARAIVAFSMKMGAMAEAGEALNTALLMYGVEEPGSRFALDCPLSSAHEDTHSRVSVGPGLVRVRELAGLEIVALGKFIARSYVQSAAGVVRAAVQSVGARDLPGAEDYVLANHELLQREAARTLATAWGAMRPNIASHETYVHVNFRYIWGHLGIAHALVAGVVPANSVAHMVSAPMELGALNDTRTTDDPSLGKSREEESVLWLALSELLANLGEGLSASPGAMRKMLRGPTRLHHEARNYSQSRVQLVIAGIGAPVLLTTEDNRGCVYDPAPSHASNDVCGVSAVTAIPQTMDYLALVTGEGEDWMPGLLERRGPVASTILRRDRGPPGGPARDRANSEQPILVHAVDSDGQDAALEAAMRGWGPELTSGEGLLCGARAVHQSLVARSQVEGTPPPLLDQVLTAVRTALTPEQLELVAAAGEDAVMSDFTVDQLGAGLRQLGDYRLGVILDDGSMQVHGGGEGQIILVHHGPGHWSSIGPAATRPMRYDRL